jgi:hypothetical protein
VTATAAVVFSGLFAGMLLAMAVLESSMRGLAATVYTQVRLIELDRLGGLATILLIPAIIATAALAWSAFRRRGAGRWVTLTALLLLLTAFAISVAINVPINTAQQGWSVAAPPSDWSGVRDRWQLAHVARTSTAALAFVLLAAVTTGRSACADSSHNFLELAAQVVAHDFRGARARDGGLYDRFRVVGK